MNFEELITDWLIIKDLKAFLHSLGLPVTARNKQELVGRILSKKELSKVDLLFVLNKEVLRGVLRKSGEKSSGSKKELVKRMLLNEILEINDQDIFNFLKGKDLSEYEDYLDFLELIKRKTSLKNLILLLNEANEQWVKKISSCIIDLEPKDSIDKLVELIRKGGKDLPCYAGYILENIMIASGKSEPIQIALNKHKDRLRARRRIIENSYELHPNMKQPTVKEFLNQIWKSAPSRKSKKDTDILELKDTTRRIDNRTKVIHKGVSDIEERLRDITNKIEKSPDEVARALSKLADSKEVKWTTRRKIKRDIDKFLKLTDYAQKVEYLTKIISTYGPVVINALRSLV